MGETGARIAKFLLLRVAVSAPVILGIVFLTFMLSRMGGQDPVAMLAGPMADEAMLTALRAQLQPDLIVVVLIWPTGLPFRNLTK